MFQRSVWPSLIVALALYCLDYALTLVSAKLYHTRVKEKFVVEGSFELNPLFAKDVDAFRSLSPRFFAGMGILGVLLAALWNMTIRIASWPQAFLFVFGGLVFLQAAVQVRHLRNLFFFMAGFGPNGVQGRIEYPRSLVLANSSFEFLTFAGLYGVIAVLTRSWLLLGGAVTCFLMAGKHCILAVLRTRQERRAAQRRATAAEHT